MSGLLKTFCPLVLMTMVALSCSQNNVKEDDSLKKYFDEASVTGSFGLFDNGHGQFTIYDLPRFRDSALLPAGSFDIIQSLIAIQTGIARNDSAQIGDSMSLRQAFRASNDKAFQVLASKIGRDTLQKWMDTLAYGNKRIGSRPDSFWLDNTLTIKADEQLGLLKKMYFDQLSFFPHTQLVVRNCLIPEGNSNYSMRYKTAVGQAANGHAIGWVLGWVEENKHVFFFVLNWEAAAMEKSPADKGLGMLHSILNQLGFFQGKK